MNEEQLADFLLKFSEVLGVSVSGWYEAAYDWYVFRWNIEGVKFQETVMAKAIKHSDVLNALLQKYSSKPYIETAQKKLAGKLKPEPQDFQVVVELSKTFSCVNERVIHPVALYEERLAKIIVNLNDNHGWTREQIADWLETLEIDITAKT